MGQVKMDGGDATGIQNDLLRWFTDKQRRLPWREDYTPYAIWVSEMMLQQTRVKTVLPYFKRWMQRFPDVASVAAADEQELLKYWEGLGYYSRVRNMHRAARHLVDEFNGRFPRNHEALLKLPGIGPYTAGAIMSLAFNADYAVVDGNVERVFARLFNIDRPVKEAATRTFIWHTAERLLPQGRARHFNQALMELGATLCLPQNPRCPDCPIQKSCAGHALGLVEQRPVPNKRKASTSIEVAIGVLVRGGRMLIQKRPPNGLMANLWEFPGGKLQAGETPQQALRREFREELQLSIRDLDPITVIRHSYTSFQVKLYAFRCRLRDARQHPVRKAAVALCWVTREQLEEFPFPAANRRLIKLL